MKITDLQKKALEIREKYKTLETKKSGKEWSDEDLVRGFLKDVDDLLQLVKNKGDKEKIAHELSDCLWSVLVLSSKLGVDIEKSFLENMEKLGKIIDGEVTN